MACLLVLVIAATVLTAPPRGLPHAARTSSPEAFWRAALSDAPMPESIPVLLRPSAGEANAPNADANVRGDDPPPPMSFNYDDYRASPSPRNQVATAAPSAKALEDVGAWNAATDDGNARASSSPTVFCFLEDAVRVGGSLPFRSGLPRAAPNDEAALAAGQAPLELYTVRAVRAVEGSSFVVCRGEAAGSVGGAVYGCRGVGPARAYVVDIVGGRGDAVAATVVCHTKDTSNCNLEHAAFHLLDVKPAGGVAVCYAVPNAQILLVKSEVSSSA